MSRHFSPPDRSALQLTAHEAEYKPHNRQFVQDYSSIRESRTNIVFPELANLLQSVQANSVLDYGGGDGTFLKMLAENNFENLHYYDISKDMRSAARSRLRETGVRIHADTSKIPHQFFDAVTMIAVWMEFASESIALENIRLIHNALHRSGHFFAVVTHPCFREEAYGTFKANFNNDDYLRDGDSFNVAVFDGEKSVTFKDYHWNFTAMTRQADSCGFLLKRIYELGEKSESGSYKRGAPWAMLHFIKSDE